MGTVLFCELALYGPEGKELEHPNYKRQQIAIDYHRGYEGRVTWGDLEGAIVCGSRLIISGQVLAEFPGIELEVPEGGKVVVPLKIDGKGDDAPDPIRIITQKKELPN